MLWKVIVDLREDTNLLLQVRITTYPSTNLTLLSALCLKDTLPSELALNVVIGHTL